MELNLLCLPKVADVGIACRLFREGFFLGKPTRVRRLLKTEHFFVVKTSNFCGYTIFSEMTSLRFIINTDF